MNGEINKALLCLTGKRLKYTVRIVTVDGQEIETQTGCLPELDWNSSTRSVVVMLSTTEDYRGKYPAWDWSKVHGMAVEQNPEVVA